MFEEDSYEQLAELYINLNESYLSEYLFCICSRSILRAGLTDEEKDAQHYIDSDLKERESAIRFLNSSTESQPSTVQRKKETDDGVSCYCSASHCSTDDSTREALHSDSGADLSETSRDPDWEDYWSKHGESIIWESWIEKYGDYIDPLYSRENKYYSSGVSENILEVSRDNSDITRLSYSSEVSDSFTNVTPLTLSELSTEESSLLSSSDSAGSVSADVAQWQVLWSDHFNFQYQLAYESFKSGQTVLGEIQEEEIKKEDSNSVNKDRIVLSKPLKCIKPSYKRNLELTSVGNLLNHLRSINVTQDDHAHESTLTKDTSNEEVPRSDTELQEYSNENLCILNERNLNFSSVEIMKLNKSTSSSSKLKQPETNFSLALLEKAAEEQSSEKMLDTEMDLISKNISTQENQARFKLKRPHEREDDRLRSAFNLFGLIYSGEGISTGSVFYKKRNIRWQNRMLNMNSHIHFDEDGQVINKDKKTEKKSEGIDSWHLASTCEIKSDFSEKDDSSEGEFYSASEEGDVRREKRKKKRKRKGLPKEILDNERLLKFWYQRYRLFSKFDDGIKLDEESWYSVTPEKVSQHTAERCRCDLIIDAFCGAGGNTIQFAFTCERVIAIDIDPHKIELAQHNARIYGVEDRIEFIVGDFIKLAPNLQADVVFLSPPWGGIGYSSQQSYSLNKILPPIGGASLFELASSITSNVAMYLPRNVNSDELLRVAGPGGSLELEQNFLGKKLIAVTAYFGELVGAYKGNM